MVLKQPESMKELLEKPRLSEENEMDFTTGQGCHSSGNRSVIMMQPEHESESRMSYATRIGFGAGDKSSHNQAMDISDKQVFEIKEVELTESKHTSKKHRLRQNRAYLTSKQSSSSKRPQLLLDNGGSKLMDLDALMMDEVDVTAERKRTAKLAYVSSRMSAAGGNTNIGQANNGLVNDKDSTSHSRQRSTQNTKVKLRKLGTKANMSREDEGAAITSFQN